MKILNRPKGFTLVEVMIVVGIIALLALIATPNFIRARNSSRSSSCINNLRVIDSAKEQYALESNAASGATTTSATITAYLKNNAMPNCLSGGTYDTMPVGELPECTLAGASSGMIPKSHRLD